MQQAAAAYGRIAQATQSPRELEANLLLKAASKLQTIRDNWGTSESDLDEALTYNRKLWTILVSSATKDDNPLPKEIKTNIANLAMFIFNHTISVMFEPAPARLNILISINRDIAAGLRGMGAPEGAPNAA
ncbi:MAG: flagellar biosynthesis regulator FlaF [Beijerinckiaceae bacterium]